MLGVRIFIATGIRAAEVFFGCVCMRRGKESHMQICVQARGGAEMKILDLFSGIGGISLGLERAGMQTVAFCEIEPFQRAVLRKHWPEVPAYEDIRAVSADLLRQSGIDHVDIVAAC